MNKMKRILATVLVLCLALGAVPLYGFATEEEDLAGRKDSLSAVEEQAVNAIQAVTAAQSDYTNTKPKDGTTAEETPFTKGLADSNSFRIPAMVTLSDGTVVAAADARWNTTYDGGGLDTIVARRAKNSNTWNYTFANYLGDNGNAYNGSGSTAFIDPALAVTSNDTIYMLVDLYPYGVALNGDGSQEAPSTDKGFNNAGKLLLKKDGDSAYNYYLDGDTIYTSSDSAVEYYTVDEYFNIFQNGTYVSNLFFSDSPYKVVRTGFLYLTTSTDKGATWSAPKLLNLKTTSEQVCLVGPGRGLVTKNGMIVFPTYSFHGDNNPTDNSQRLSFIYSTDGTTWSRSAELDHNWASEAAVVELKDGTLRFFFRNGSTYLYYVDYKNDAWGTPQSTGIHTNSNCQISAITYSKTIDGKQVILVSCPAGPSGGSNQSGATYRVNGKIFAFTVEDGNALTHKGTISVPSVNSTNNFMYSCLTELADGKVAILYEDRENDWGTADTDNDGLEAYYTMSYAEYDLTVNPGLTFDTTNTPDADVQNVLLQVGETKKYTDKTGNYVNAAGNVAPNSSIVKMELTGTETAAGTTEQLTAKTPPVSAGSVTCYISDGNGNFLTLSNGALTNTTDRAAATEWTVTYVDTPSWGNGASRYTVSANGYYIQLSGSALATTTGTSNVNHYYKPDVGFYGSSDGTNAWVYNSGWTVGTAGDTSAKLYTIETVEIPSGSATEISFTGLVAGETTAVIGSTQYNITVTDRADVVNVELTVGGEKTVIDETGNYKDDPSNFAPDAWFAKMELEGTSGGGTTITPLTNLSSGSQNAFYIQVSEGVYLTADGGTTTKLDEAGKWYAYNAYPSYCTIRSISTGNYLGVGNDGVVKTSQSTAYMKMKEGVLLGYYSNNPAGTPVQVTVDEGVTQTEITFTGVAPGKTAAIVGNTQYNITVRETRYITLEAGTIESDRIERMTYTEEDVTWPDKNTATLTTLKTGIDIPKKLTEITAPEDLDDGFYLIVNAKEVANEEPHLLTHHPVVIVGNSGEKDGLYVTSRVTVNTAEQWYIQSTGTENNYYIMMDNQYLTAAGYYAKMSDTQTPVMLNYVAGSGWTISDNTTWEGLGHNEGPYYLYDGVGSGYEYGEGAMGSTDTPTAGGNGYWKIYKVEDGEPAAYTDVVFRGENAGTTQAVVGAVTYVITVIETIYPTVHYQLDGTTIHTETMDIQAGDSHIILDQYIVVDVTEDIVVKETDAEGNVVETVVGQKVIGQKLYQVEDTDLERTTEGDTNGYTVPVTEYTGAATEITVAVGETKTLAATLDLDQGQYVTWYTADGNYASVAGVYDNTKKQYTADARLVGNKETGTDGPVQVVGLIHNADGTVVGTQVWNVTVEGSISHGSANYTPTLEIDADLLENSTLYYSINGGALIEVTDADLYEKDGKTLFKMVHESYDVGVGIMLFAAPKDGYALSYMSSTNSDHQYYSLMGGDPDGVGSPAWPLTDKYTYEEDYDTWFASATKDQNGKLDPRNYPEVYKDIGMKWALGEGNLTEAQLRTLYATAIAKGCTGVLCFTKNNNSTYSSVITIKSDPLLSVRKDVMGILPPNGKEADFRTYSKGMVAGAGELVYYTITITLPRPAALQANKTPVMMYDFVELEDRLPDAYFYSKAEDTAEDGKWNGELAHGSPIRDISAEVQSVWSEPWEDNETERKVECYVVYKIKAEDIPRFTIENTVDLRYGYNSMYAKEDNATAAASSVAAVTVVSKAMKNVIIDFTQPIRLTNLTNDYMKFAFVDSEATTHPQYVAPKATYGFVSVTRENILDANGDYTYDGKDYPQYNYTITYTPDPSRGVMQEPDVVWIYGVYIDPVTDLEYLKVINSFVVYPATTIHYEEDYIDWGADDSHTTHGDWTLKGEDILVDAQGQPLTQHLDYAADTVTKNDVEVADKLYNYGYDPVYNGSNEASRGTQATTSELGAKGEFTFTGTGFEIYANSTPDTGYMTVLVQSVTGNGTWLYTVNTKSGPGTTEATTEQTGNFYSVPVVSVQGLEHGQYTVSIIKTVDVEPKTEKVEGVEKVVTDDEGNVVYVTVDPKLIQIDGIRIFGTTPDERVFSPDGEDKPSYVELRDQVLTGISVGGHNISDVDQDSLYAVGQSILQQVYDDAGTTAGAILLSDTEQWENKHILDLLDNGPKNELYLYENQSVTFVLKDGVTAQVGMKTVQGAEASYTITSGTYNTDTTDEKTDTLNSSTDMFYHTVSGEVVITNTGDQIVSITLLKLFDLPANETSAFDTVSAAAIGEAAYTLMSMRAPADKVATLTVNYVTQAGHKIVSVGDQIIALPDHKIETVTLTKVQTDDDQAVFTAEEIRSALPAGAVVRDLKDITVPYGQSATRTLFASQAGSVQGQMEAYLITRVF